MQLNTNSDTGSYKKRVRTEAVIHLDRLERNIKRALDRLPEKTKLIAVLKGDAYGHGIAGVYPVFKALGVSSFAVSCWEEGKTLREAGAETEEILILGDTIEDQQDKLVKYNITQTIFDYQRAFTLNEEAKKAGVIQPINIKIDTGMSRLGFPAGEPAVRQVKRIAALSNLKITGAFTHFMCADEPDNPKTNQQLIDYLKTIALLEVEDIHIPCLHTANSPALILRPETYLDAVRVGDAIFGLAAVDDEEWFASGIEEVLTWRTYVAMLKEIPEGTQVGYGATFTAARPTLIATIPVGFADGYSRRLSNKGFVVINGQRAPIIGRVCMDQFMVDVTDLPEVNRGDEVELLGDSFGIKNMADLLEINVDEVVCGISKRVPRTYAVEE